MPVSHKNCHVYLMHMCVPAFAGTDGREVFKVGISTNPDARYNSIKTGSPWPLRMAQTWRVYDANVARTIELEFHKANEKARLQGEWFKGWVAGAACEIDALVGGWWINRYGDRGLADFMKWVGMSDQATLDHMLAHYGEVIG